jgi:hypothetical protein
VLDSQGRAGIYPSRLRWSASLGLARTSANDFHGTGEVQELKLRIVACFDGDGGAEQMTILMETLFSESTQTLIGPGARDGRLSPKDRIANIRPAGTEDSDIELEPDCGLGRG